MITRKGPSANQQSAANRKTDTLIHRPTNLPLTNQPSPHPSFIPPPLPTERTKQVAYFMSRLSLKRLPNKRKILRFSSNIYNFFTLGSFGDTCSQSTPIGNVKVPQTSDNWEQLGLFKSVLNPENKFILSKPFPLEVSFPLK